MKSKKKVPHIEPLSYLQSQETKEFTNSVYKDRATVVFMFSFFDSNQIFAFEKMIFLLKWFERVLLMPKSSTYMNKYCSRDQKKYGSTYPNKIKRFVNANQRDQRNCFHLPRVDCISMKDHSQLRVDLFSRDFCWNYQRKALSSPKENSTVKQNDAPWEVLFRWL